MLSLFLTPPMQKVAQRGTPLSGDAGDWPADVLKEAYAQLPYLDSYEVSVVLSRQDPQRSYALGYLDVANKAGTPLALQPGSERPLAEQMTKKARVPFVVKEGELRPLRVLSNGSVIEPMSERRLGSALVRADVARVGGLSQNRSLVDQLYPPATGQYGTREWQKESAARSLLEKIGATISEQRRQAVLEQIRQDPELLAAVESNEAFAGSVAHLLHAQPLTAEQCKVAVRNSMRPDVVQVQRVAGCYQVKQANATVYEPTEAPMTRDEVIALLGEELVHRVDQEGVVTVGRSFSREEQEPPLAQVIDFGRYRVKEAGTGRWQEGWVFPHVVDLNMNLVGRSLFLGEGTHAEQAKIAGVATGGQVFPQASSPSGLGMFVATNERAQAFCTVPLQVGSLVRTPEESYYLAEMEEGRRVKLSMVHGLRKIASLGPDHYAIPAEMDFVPLPRRALPLVQEQDHHLDGRKEASAVYVRSDGRTYDLEGVPLSKIASRERTFAKKADAMLLLVAAGAHPTRADAVLAEAALHGQAKVAGLRQLTTYADARRDAVEQHVLPVLREFRFDRPSLVKEAAGIADPSTVDSVLALGFINPDNISMFLDNIPQLEKAACQLAELCLASQLGLQQLNEDAVFRAMRGVDGVLDGLYAIEQAGGDKLS